MQKKSKQFKPVMSESKRFIGGQKPRFPKVGEIYIDKDDGEIVTITSVDVANGIVKIYSLELDFCRPGREYDLTYFQRHWRLLETYVKG